MITVEDFPERGEQIQRSTTFNRVFCFSLLLVSAIAFATILAVVAGLTMAASTSFAHDIWFNIVKNGVESEQGQVLVARVTAGVVGVLAILLAIGLRTLNVAACTSTPGCRIA